MENNVLGWIGLGIITLGIVCLIVLPGYGKLVGVVGACIGILTSWQAWFKPKEGEDGSE